MIGITTHARLRSARYTLPMLLASRLIGRELRDAEGCYRFANVVTGAREFWTITMWKDAASVRARMRDGVHGRVLWKRPQWLECYWGMRWHPAAGQGGTWPGRPMPHPDEEADRSQAPAVSASAAALRAVPGLRAMAGEAVGPERRALGDSHGASYRLGVPPWRFGSAFEDLRRLRATAERDPDGFRVRMGVGTGAALYLLAVVRSSAALDRLLRSDGHRRLVDRWGARLWWSAWEPESEFGRWGAERLRDGSLANAPVALEAQFDPEPSAAREARRALRDRFADLSAGDLHTLQLLASELIGNSVRHAGLGSEDRIGLTVRIEGDSIRMEVADRGRRFEPVVPGVKSLEDDSGWGLFSIDRLADRWGVVDGAPRHVWIELALAG